MKKIDKLNFLKVKNIGVSKTPLRKWEEKPQTGGKWVQIGYPIKDLYPEYMKNFYNSITILKMDKDLSSDFTRRYVIAHEKKLNISSH